jgi:FAD/FMN-containing dehydrogenase
LSRGKIPRILDRVQRAGHSLMSAHSVPNPGRRTFLAQGLASAGLLTLSPTLVLAAPTLVVPNVTGLYSVEVAKIVVPASAMEVADAVRNWDGKVAVGGGRYSMGGQVAIRGGLHLDMRQLNSLVWLRPDEKSVRVQAGMRWRDLQDILDPVNLAVRTMQSYSNFTVGGAVSVNAHGRYVGHGPMGNTVRALQLVLADGRVIEASDRQNVECFRAAIGGYGAVGVITEVELDLADNVRIERVVADVPLKQYPAFFRRQVLADPRSVLHNADLAPPNFDAPVCITWRKTDAPLTEMARLVPRGERYSTEQNVLFALTELPGSEYLRKSVVKPMLIDPSVKWLSREASLDVAQLEPRTRRIATYVLQEYFVPERNFLPFAKGLAQVLMDRRVMAVNVSIRHSPADTVSLLPWAQEDVFSFVLYYKQRTHLEAQEEVGRWTRELINLALANEGRHYLPYQPNAAQDQFDRAYPEAALLREVKRRVDPDYKFSNQLWARYL